MTAFRGNVPKSKSSTTMTDEDESITSEDLQSCNVDSRSTVSENVKRSTRFSWLKKQRHSQSVNREGDSKPNHSKTIKIQ